MWPRICLKVKNKKNGSVLGFQLIPSAVALPETRSGLFGLVKWV